MIIRPCEKKDLTEIYAIEQSSFAKGAWTYEQFLYEYEQNDCSTILVVEEGKVFGYIDFWILFERGEICKIAIAPGLREKGVGNILLKEALMRMISQNVESISLEVRVNNEIAINLYEKNGFHKVITKKGYYQDGEDAYLMLLEVGLQNG